MKIAAHAPTADIDGAWVPQTFTSVVVRTQQTGGTTIETLTPTSDGQGGYYTFTTDALYADGTEYWADWCSTILGVGQIGTIPFFHRAAAGVLPTAPPALACTGVTANTATFALLPPADAHYSYSALLYMPAGASAYMTISPFTGGMVTGLSANTAYTACAIAYNTAGLPSLPSAPPVSFLTLMTDGGLSNMQFAARTDDAADDEVSDFLDITVPYHRQPIQVRGTTCRIRLAMCEVDNQIELARMDLLGDLLGRRRD